MITSIMTSVYTALHQMQMVVGFIVHLSAEQLILARTILGACARPLPQAGQMQLHQMATGLEMSSVEVS